MPPFAIQLLAGDNLLAQSSSPLPTHGEFVETVTTYMAAANDPLLGESLEIRLVNTDPVSQFAFVHFDDVRLNAVATIPTWNVDANGNWSQATNWSNGAVPNSADGRAVLGGVITQPRTVNVDVPITVGRIDFDTTSTYTIAGSNALTLDATSGEAQINVARGSHAIGAPLTLADNTVIGVSPAESTLAMSGVVNAAGVNVGKSGPGKLSVNRIQAGALSIDAGTVQIKPDPSAPGSGPSVFGAFAIAGGTAPTATLDLNNGSAVIDYSGASPAATIREQIISGRGGAGLGASWSGRGITSSTAAAANAIEPESRSIGYAQNSGEPRR
ncbi:MAG: hypothetical protein WD894_08730 [Pirellulales bacterium]